MVQITIFLPSSLGVMFDNGPSNSYLTFSEQVLKFDSDHSQQDCDKKPFFLNIPQVQPSPSACESIFKDAATVGKMQW